MSFSVGSKALGSDVQSLMTRLLAEETRRGLTTQTYTTPTQETPIYVTQAQQVEAGRRNIDNQNTGLFYTTLALTRTYPTNLSDNFVQFNKIGVSADMVTISGDISALEAQVRTVVAVYCGCDGECCNWQGCTWGCGNNNGGCGRCVCVAVCTCNWN